MALGPGGIENYSASRAYAGSREFDLSELPQKLPKVVSPLRSGSQGYWLSLLGNGAQIECDLQPVPLW